MAEVKIMVREKIMAMPLASDKWRVCERIICGDASKKIDEFFTHFLGVTSSALSNFI